jgi:hypothetical protein
MKTPVSLASVCLSLACAAMGAEPQVVFLWPSGAPGSESKTGEEKVQVQPAGDHIISNVHKPSITVYLPSKETATGAAIVIARAAATPIFGWTMKAST